MTDSQNRFNTVVSKVLNISPKARETHDTYFLKYKQLKYGQMNSKPKGIEGESAAYLKVSTDKNMQLVLNTYFSDAMLARMSLHELEHAQQMGKLFNSDLASTKFYDSLNTVIAHTMLGECHAFNGEVEGPLTGFLRDMSQADNKNIPFYKEYFAQDFYLKDNAKIFVEGMFNKKIPDPKMNILDFIGQEYFSNGYHLNLEMHKQAIHQGRKAFASNFFSMNNRDYLESYTLDAINTYTSYQETESNILENDSITEKMKFNFLFMKEAAKPKLTLGNIQKLLNDDDDIYLSAQDWKAILKADNNDGFVANLMMTSSHKNTYQQASKIEIENRNRGFKPKFH